MRIIFVRHGHPNYEKDCLTPLGHLHAKAAAQRLKDEGICRIYSSTCGRALETAQHTADLLGLPVTSFDYMREITWGTAQGEPLPYDAHPWDTVDAMVAQGQNLMNADWKQQEPFRRNTLIPLTQRIETSLDQLLEAEGYTREGNFYRVTGENADHTIAIFSHGGSSSVMLGHLFNLPFPFVCAAMGPDYTAITIAALGSQQGKLLSPHFELMNDARHIRGLEIGNYFGK